MSESTRALELQALAVGYAGRTVLREVNCAIEVGEVVALLGRNGAGKSTLLRALAGLSTPHSGRICWFGASQLPSGVQRARTLGVVLQQEPAPSLTVREVLGLSGADAATIDACLEAHRLQPLAARRVSELSGGERQRVALARAAVVAPMLYVLDEPTNQLDQVERRAFSAWLSATRAHAAIVIATHSRSLLASADTLLHVGAGRVCAHGTQALDALLESDP